MAFEKIVLVTRKTRLEGLVQRFNTKSQARFYINQNARQRKDAPADAFALYQGEHETYQAALERLHSELQTILQVQVIERGFLPNFLFAPTDLVVVIGIDGLVVNAAKYLDGQPVVAVNPDPEHIDGVLLPFTVDQAPQAVRRVLEERYRAVPITMAEARLNDGQSLLAFNDLFVGARSHVSARYQLHWGQTAENQSSSGLIIATGAGSTGWLSSMFNMANGMVAGFGRGSKMAAPRLPWDSEKLVFVVREPFVSKTSSAGIVCGEITPKLPLVVESQMPEGGVIFSDGVEADFLAFNSGMVATIGLSAKKTNLVTAAGS
jgi:NAD kinase